MSWGAPLPPPVPPPPAPVATTRPRRGVVGWTAGATLIVIGLAAGAVMSAVAMAAPLQTVRGFARARAGCTTTLQFDRTGTFTLYLESKGRTAVSSGECGAGTYEHTATSVPSATFELIDPAGDTVTAASAVGRVYRLASFRGEEIGRVVISERGDYQMTVISADDVAVAVGGDPNAAKRLWAIAAIVTTLLTVLMGVTLVVLNRR